VELHPDWDVTGPGFLITILRIMALLGAIAIAVGLLLARGIFSGLFSGVVLVILYYLATLHAGRIFLRTRQYFRVMFWLLGSQALLWIGMAVLLAVVKVNGIGFAIGVSVLPGSIILTILYWWLIKNKGVIP